jgi:hypothetical protein
MLANFDGVSDFDDAAPEPNRVGSGRRRPGGAKAADHFFCARRSVA